MKKLQSNDTGKAKLFEQKGLNSLTKNPVWLSIIVYTIIWVALIIAHLTFGSASSLNSVILYLFAMGFWTFFEYMAHRFLFHWINDTPKVQRFHYLIHGVHHEYPRDKERLIMPIAPGFILVIVLTTIFFIPFGSNAFIWMAGFINGWAIYVTIHYMVHTYQPIQSLKILWTHHAKHHYKAEDKAFGVSTPFWDKLFGTMPD
ncbi:MAG: fatty acid hydroxylase [Bacteroidetes bacterium]|jgi:4-hydroxysphinganine ceramide fatty acyl 2-hydroxylase|nr:fatty acid hydroxylase [Bacteroidota bacterium]